VPAIARDEVASADVSGHDAVGILLDRRHLVSAKHRYALADEALFQEGFEPGLRDGHRGGVAGPPRAAVQLDGKRGEMPTEFAAGQCALEQRIQQATQVEHLRGARLQRSRPGLRTAGPLLFQHHGRYPGQGQLVGQHQARGAGSDHDHLSPHDPLLK
jgi:hypothetical protein